MEDYTISYSRQRQLEKEETLIDEEVNKAKITNHFDGTTREKSLKELDEFVSDGSIRDWIIRHPIMVIPTSLIFTMLIELAILSFVALIVPFVIHQPANLSMLAAIAMLGLIPSLLASFYICDEIFVKPNRFEKLREKTLGTGYEISKNIIDCPIEVKKELYGRLECGDIFFSYNKNQHTLCYYDESGKEDCINLFHLASPFYTIYKSNEFKYFKEQLTDDVMYKIVDVLTDKAFKE